MHDTLLSALPALRRFEGRAQLSTYLVRALTNRWKNRLRSQKRSRFVDWFSGRVRSRVDEAVEPLDPPDERPNAEERLEAAERAVEVRRALARLAPSRRLALVLREVEELSYEEIAELTGVPVGTVRSRLARAREELRRELDERR